MPDPSAVTLPLGLLLVLVVVVDAAGALVLPRGSTARWRLARLFYRSTWAGWRTLGRRLPSAETRDAFLALYAPLSLLSLLALWLAGLVLGWALIYAPFAEQLAGEDGFGSIVYFSGVTLLTVGFGDITPTDTLTRSLAVIEATMGLGTVALVISYLPALYGAYSRRESRLLTLDHPSGEPIDAPALICLHAPDGDRRVLYDQFRRWELWVAEVLESHVAYPMLALFRSQHLGQSWVTALGILADSGALASATIPGADGRAPYLAFQRSRRAITEIARRLGVQPVPGAAVTREDFAQAYARLGSLGIELVPEDRAWPRFHDYREGYGATLGALMDFLLAPPAFWGHSAFDLAAPPGEAFERL